MSTNLGKTKINLIFSDGSREGRQRSPTIAVEVEIVDIKPMQSNTMVS